jgi:sphingomyelin phosphodiesterase acid-like 3
MQQLRTLVVHSSSFCTHPRARTHARTYSATDFHVDPYFGNETYGLAPCNVSGAVARYGCDAPLDLARAAITNASAVVPSPDFILIAGDTVRHDAHLMPDPHADVGQVLGAVLALVHESFPGTVVSHGSLADAHTRIVQTVGNNDFEPDYVVRVPVSPPPPARSPGAQLAQNPQLALFEHEWLNDTVDVSQHDDLARGGYYEVEVVPGLRVLSVNTVVYSFHHCNVGPYPTCRAVESLDPLPADPFGQLAWLEDRLTAAGAAGAKVFILGHIPPCLGSYDDSEFWRPQYTDAFLKVLGDHGPVLRGVLFGHLHSDEWRADTSVLQRLGVPFLLSSSVTPIYDNNPSFKVRIQCFSFL